VAFDGDGDESVRTLTTSKHPASGISCYCSWPLVPTLWCHKVSETLHNFSHAGIRATRHLVSVILFGPD